MAVTLATLCCCARVASANSCTAQASTRCVHSWVPGNSGFVRLSLLTENGAVHSACTHHGASIFNISFPTFNTRKNFMVTRHLTSRFCPEAFYSSVCEGKAHSLSILLHVYRALSTVCWCQGESTYDEEHASLLHIHWV